MSEYSARRLRRAPFVCQFGWRSASGNNDFAIVEAGSRKHRNTRFFTLGGVGTLPTTAWTYNAINGVPTTTSNLGTSTIEPLFGQANTQRFLQRNRPGAHCLDLEECELRTAASGACKDSDSIGRSSRRARNRSTVVTSPAGYYNPLEMGLFSGQRVHRQGVYLRHPEVVHQRRRWNRGAVLLLSQPGQRDCRDPGRWSGGRPEFPGVHLRAEDNAYQRRADHVKEVTPAPYPQFDFGTDFNGMPFKALVGVRYEKTNVTANSLQNVQRPRWSG